MLGISGVGNVGFVCLSRMVVFLFTTAPVLAAQAWKERKERIALERQEEEEREAERKRIQKEREEAGVYEKRLFYSTLSSASWVIPLKQMGREGEMDDIKYTGIVFAMCWDVLGDLLQSSNNILLLLFKTFTDALRKVKRRNRAKVPEYQESSAAGQDPVSYLSQEPYESWMERQDQHGEEKKKKVEDYKPGLATVPENTLVLMF